MVDLLVDLHAAEGLHAHCPVGPLEVPAPGVIAVVGQVIAQLPADLLHYLILGVSKVSTNGFESALGGLAGDLGQFDVALVFFLLILHLFYYSVVGLAPSIKALPYINYCNQTYHEKETYLYPARIRPHQ